MCAYVASDTLELQVFVDHLMKMLRTKFWLSTKELNAPNCSGVFPNP